MMPVRQRFRTRQGLPALVLASAAAPCLAQESTNVPVATQPSVGRFYLREKLQYISFCDDPSPTDRDIDRFVLTSSLSYGISRTISATLDVPLVLSSTSSQLEDDRDEFFGVYDLSLSLKWRFWQEDFGPVDSIRLAAVGGIEIPTYDKDHSSESWDPYAGLIFTAILGRHGVNQSLRYKFNSGDNDFTEFTTRGGDGENDAFFYDTSYLFRLAPSEYSADTKGALYLTLELNGLYETNDDNEIILGPGILYEARRFAIEATVGFPIVGDVDERPEMNFVASIGFRFLF